jgi:hypothetical protein
MIKLSQSVLGNSLKFSALLLMVGSTFFWIGKAEGIAVVTGILLSSVFVVSSGWILEAFQNADGSLFIQVYIFSIAIRFIVVLLLFGILLATTKIDEIYFTVSFIISYLCQSVTEMILINKFLQKSGSKRQ